MMKLNFTLLLILLAFNFSYSQFHYINPVPGSQYQNPQTNIILKNGSFIDKQSVADKNLVKITGSLSGDHDWTARLSDDNISVIVKPKTFFKYGETVTVTVNPKLRTENGQQIEGTTFSFNTRNEITAEEKERYRQSSLENFIESFGYDPTEKKNGQKIQYPLDSMPTFQINVNQNPPGRVFYCNQQELNEQDSNSFPTIIKNDGTIEWARDLGRNGHDFKINQNGYLTYYNYSGLNWIVMDSNFNIIDSIQCGNGYETETNGHDIQIYPDGHIFLIAFSDQTVNMTAYGGVPNADVKEIVLQELDANKDVVFEWKSFDHFQFTDAIAQVPLTNSSVDYCHTNSIERDIDGNIIISCRNFSELTKISHATGNIIWRMGGENNQFTFVNDNIPEHYSQQHDLRRLPNGNISIFNNGNFLPVQRSSAKEYAINEQTKTATLVWYYEHPDVGIHQVFGRASGNAQRETNGNTMICWGTIFWDQNIPNMTEVDANKNIIWEMTFDETGQKSYRAHRYNWNPCSRVTGYTMKANVKPVKVNISWREATGAKAYEVNYKKLGATVWTKKKTNNLKASLTNLAPSTSYEWKIKTLCSLNPSITSTYSVTDTFTTMPLKTLEAEVIPGFEVSVYPVPANDHITISLSSARNATVVIRSLLGSIVYENKMREDADGTLNVDVHQWAKGLYIVEVSGNEDSATQKFIVE